VFDVSTGSPRSITTHMSC